MRAIEKTCGTCTFWARNCDMPIGYCFNHTEPKRTDEGDLCDDWDEDDDSRDWDDDEDDFMGDDEDDD